MKICIVDFKNFERTQIGKALFWKGLWHVCLVHFIVNNASYASFFDMKLEKLLVNDKIRASSNVKQISLPSIILND